MQKAYFFMHFFHCSFRNPVSRLVSRRNAARERKGPEDHVQVRSAGGWRIPDQCEMVWRARAELTIQRAHIQEQGGHAEMRGPV